jgi:hypothetical protein
MAIKTLKEANNVIAEKDLIIKELEGKLEGVENAKDIIYKNYKGLLVRHETILRRMHAVNITMNELLNSDNAATPIHEEGVYSIQHMMSGTVK